jgi:hypothetical protein
MVMARRATPSGAACGAAVREVIVPAEPDRQAAFVFGRAMLL